MKDASIQWLKHLPVEEVYGLIGEAMFLVVLSQCYETFAVVIIEGFVKRTAVIASGLGAIAVIVDDGRTGLHFKLTDPVDLATEVRQIPTDPVELARMRQVARQQFARNFTPDSSHKILMAIYERALRVVPKLRALARQPDAPTSDSVWLDYACLRAEYVISALEDG
jgi:glycosyltransferase involved in cell wall biosynthesis